ncbi:MAG: amidohydrolase family protein, partial [Actinomycetota bacterium]
LDGEVIYPSVGMLVCNHSDLDLKKALFDGYNRWIAEYCAAAPERLFGLGQSAMRTPEEGIADLEAIAAAGLRGVMMPGTPGPAYDDGPDYDDPAWDEVYQAAEELGLVLSFHILTGRSYKPRGPKLNSFMSIIRGNQDLIGTFVFGGVFDRNPDLRIVCVEADAGWAPHFAYRMDHAYDRHRTWLGGGGPELARKPSEYMADHVKLTFQDDWSAFRMAEAGLIDPSQLLWANDFPHSDSTWPYSQSMLAQHTASLADDDVARILGGNTIELYRLDDLFPAAG